MTIAKLVSLLCKKEDGKSLVKVGDMREIVSILSDLIYEEFQVLGYKETPKLPTLKVLYLNGKKRANRVKPPEPIKED